jgi:hypothetical protein
MFFATRPRDLSDVEILDWIPLPESNAEGDALEPADDER